jgi:hypothetical protein
MSGVTEGLSPSFQDVWFLDGLALDDSPLIVHDVGMNDIYALDVDFP